MRVIEKLEKIAGTVKIIEEIMDNKQTTQSPRVQRLLKGIQTVEKAHSAMKQAQQVQDLLHGGKNHISTDNALPLLLLLLNNFTALETSEEEG